MAAGITGPARTARRSDDARVFRRKNVAFDPLTGYVRSDYRMRATSAAAVIRLAFLGKGARTLLRVLG